VKADQSLQLLNDGVLAGSHLGQGPVEILGSCGTGHGRGEQHSRAEGARQQQLISHLQSAFAPGVSWFAAVHGQTHLQAQRQGCRSLSASFQGVPTDQLAPLGFESGTQSPQGLTKQVLLQGCWGLGQGDHGHRGVHAGTTRPEIGARMQRC